MNRKRVLTELARARGRFVISHLRHHHGSCTDFVFTVIICPACGTASYFRFRWHDDPDDLINYAKTREVRCTCGTSGLPTTP